MKTFREFLEESSASDRLRRLASSKQKKDIFGNLPTKVSPNILQNLERNAAERQNNRYPEQSNAEKPQTIRSRATAPPRFPLTRNFSFNRNPQNPLTPQIRDERRASAGASNKGKTTPSGSKLFRQHIAGTSIGDDPLEVIMSAGKQGRNPKPKSSRSGGGFTNSPRNAGTSGNIFPRSASERSGLPRSFKPGSGRKFGISGIGLAD